MYFRCHTNFQFPFKHAVPFVQEIFGNAVPSGSFPTGAFQQLATASTSSRSVYVEHAPKRNYVMQWNLSVARELSSTLALTLGYVGSRGVHQPYRVDNIDSGSSQSYTGRLCLAMWTEREGNPCASGFLPTGTQSSPSPTVALNPNFGRISANLWQADSFYDALQVDLAKRVSRGFQFHVAYTWGKSIDTLSATAADDSFRMDSLTSCSSTRELRGDCRISTSLRPAVVSFTWELPSPTWGASTRHSGRAAPLWLLDLPNWALGGWQLGALYR